jgi:hypothetical protein
LPLHIQLCRQHEVLAAETMTWFRIMGSEAHPAIPRLAGLLVNSKEIGVQLGAMEALGAIGDPAIPQLLALYQTNTTSISDFVRYSLLAVEEAGPHTRQAVPLVQAWLRDEKDPVGGQAAAALGRWRIEPETSVPALIQCLERRDDNVVLAAVQSLRSFGRSAKPAVPALVWLLDYHSAAIQMSVTNALRLIAPEELEKIVAANRQKR